MFLSLPGSLPLVLSFERIPPALVRASFIFCQSVDAMDNFPLGYGVCGSVRFFPTARPLLRFLGISSSVNLLLSFVHVAQLLTEKRKLTYRD